MLTTKIGYTLTLAIAVAGVFGGIETSSRAIAFVGGFLVALMPLWIKRRQ